MLPLANASCLITDHRQFEVVDYPPSILPTPSATLLPNRINAVQTDAVGGPDGGMATLYLDVVVSDPNVDQALRWRVFINRPVTYTGGPDLEDTITGGTDVARDPLSIPIALTQLRQDGHAHCNKIELWVSSDFRSGRQPTHAGDVASMTWFINGTTASETAVEMGDCP